MANRKNESLLWIELLRQYPGLRDIYAKFDGILGKPVWVLFSGPLSEYGSFLRDVADSRRICKDGRSLNSQTLRFLHAELKKRSEHSTSFLLESSKRVRHFYVPVYSDGHLKGFFGVNNIGKNVDLKMLHIFRDFSQLVFNNFSKDREIARLTDTLRPRAVALSTVHTVHRIINSTLNLDELITRLAHLTAQVMRSQKCAIYLLNNFLSTPPNEVLSKFKNDYRLTCKANVGFSSSLSNTHQAVPADPMISYVAKSAKIILQKDRLYVPLIDEDLIGVSVVKHKRDLSAYNHFDQEILTTLAEEAVIAIKNAKLYEEQRKVTLGTIQSLAMILGSKTGNHHAKAPWTLELVIKMAKELAMDDATIQALHYATLLKEASRVGIPDQILSKADKLTQRELKLLKRHPAEGAKIVRSFESLKPVVPIILHIREKFDGTGYPKGLKGSQIPIGARILAIADAFEALIMGRPYRSKHSLNEAILEIQRNSGTQFDPALVQIFVKILSSNKDLIKLT